LLALPDTIDILNLRRTHGGKRSSKIIKAVRSNVRELSFSRVWCAFGISQIWRIGQTFCKFYPGFYGTVAAGPGRDRTAGFDDREAIFASRTPSPKMHLSVSNDRALQWSPGVDGGPFPQGRDGTGPSVEARLFSFESPRLP